MTLRRRVFVQRLLSCVGLLSISTLSVRDTPEAALARRIVSLTAIPSALGLDSALNVPQLLAQVFGTSDFAALLALDDAALKQTVSERIQQDYRQGDLVLQQGWWLTRSEIALLQLAQV